MHPGLRPRYKDSRFIIADEMNPLRRKLVRKTVIPKKADERYRTRTHYETRPVWVHAA